MQKYSTKTFEERSQRVIHLYQAVMVLEKHGLLRLEVNFTVCSRSDVAKLTCISSHCRSSQVTPDVALAQYAVVFHGLVMLVGEFEPNASVTGTH